MNSQDFQEFATLLDETAIYYNQKEPFHQIAIKVYFAALVDYSLDQVRDAIFSHIKNHKNGQFVPKVADIIRFIEGSGVTTDDVIAAARLTKTPFGILCRIQIGHHDLNMQTDMFYLKQRAEECRQLLPEWKAKAINGDYTDHQISIMLKYDVDPCRPFMDGLQPPPNAASLNDRSTHIVTTERHKLDCIRPPGTEEVESNKHLEAAPEVSRFIALELKKMEET